MSDLGEAQSMLDEAIGHDQAFKELISTFFMEFLELFLPEFAATIDPTSVIFLQQEYFIDLVEGEEKIVDLLAEVRLAGEEATILIHLEPQSTSQTHFPQRLFFYFALLHQKHLKPIYPIAVFSYDKPKKAAKTNYSVGFPALKVLEFNFAAIQLNQLDWRDYLDRPNPVAAALMSKMKIAKKDRPKVKAECLRLMVTLKLDPAKSRLISKFVDSYLRLDAKSRLISKFVDSYLRLDAKEEELFQVEIDKMGMTQKEAIMQTMTSWEEKGMEKGMEKERQTIALNMLKDNFSLEQISRLTGLTISELEGFANAQRQQLQADHP